MSTRTMPIAAILAATTACTAAAAERSFPVTAFERVAASGSEDVTIVTGKAPSVTASGPKDRLDRLDIRVEGDTLQIGHKGKGWSWGSSDPVKIRVTLGALKGVRLAGSGDVTADSGSGPAFTADLSGSGNLSIARIDSPSVVLTTAGSGNITAAGRCNAAKLSISGSGDMKLGSLACADIDARIAGSGNVAARASRNAVVKISGSGNVDITGGARCQSSTSGSGSVNCG